MAKGNRTPRISVKWNDLQTHYEAGHTWKKVALRFGISVETIRRATLRGLLISRGQAQATALVHKTSPRRHSNVTKQKLSKIATDRGFGGKNFRKTFLYNGVLLESSYELAIAKDLDSNNIRWIRPGRFQWTDMDGKLRHYTPDFYLPEYDIYLDPKNSYLQQIDVDKIHRASVQNNIKVLILNKSQLTWEQICGIGSLVDQQPSKLP